ALAGATHLLLHVFQQEHYEPRRLRGWVAHYAIARLALPEAGLLLVAGAACSIAVMEAGAAGIGLGILLSAMAVRAARVVWNREQIKPLVFTPRARRLFGVQLGLGALVLIVVIAFTGGEDWGPAAAGAAGALLLLLAPYLLADVANTLLRPVQRA